MKKQIAKKWRDRTQIYHEIVRNHIFDNYAVRPLPEMIERIEKYRGVLENYIYSLRGYYTIHWRDSLKRDKKWGIQLHTSDLRRGWETYGYKSIEEIEGDLSYISDRFACEFRLQWLLDSPEGYKKLINSN
jgi:hypothetical protein